MGKDKHQPTEADVKVATVNLESIDNMATLPVGQHLQQGSDSAIAEKHNSTNKEMELKCVQPKPSKKYVGPLFRVDSRLGSWFYAFGRILLRVTAFFVRLEDLGTLFFILLEYF